MRMFIHKMSSISPIHVLRTITRLLIIKIGNVTELKVNT